jgi:hypothetical protein
LLPNPRFAIPPYLDGFGLVPHARGQENCMGLVRATMLGLAAFKESVFMKLNFELIS